MTNGQIAYEAFCRSGRKIPEPWDLKDRFERAMWDAVGEAVAAAERERCAKAAEDYLTRGRNPHGRAVAEAILKGA